MGDRIFFLVREELSSDQHHPIRAEPDSIVVEVAPSN
jgi:hypothetical protein